VLVEPAAPPDPDDVHELVLALELVLVLDVAAPPDPVEEVEATEVLDPGAPA
jgi:hypothetical protein